jgi:hypothetical protein
LDRDFARALDPLALARDCGIEPDEKQGELLTSASQRVLVNCTRQWGKSTVAALICVHEALYRAPAMIILVSPSQQQSSELFRKVVDFLAKLPEAPKCDQETTQRLSLSNGSRVISLPGSERTVRGYSAASLVVIDEAARVDDAMLAAIRPMLATRADGRFIALSTPAGKRGWFFEFWTEGEDWDRIEVKAANCPRISPLFLKEEMSALGPHRYAEEYECQFLDAVTSCFSTQLLQLAMTDDFPVFI